MKLSHIARSSLIIALFFGVDKVLGFVRQILTARQFSLTYDMDVFNAANNLPDLLSALISGGALGIAVLPVLSEYLEKTGRRGCWDLFSRVLNLAFLVTAGFSILLALFAGPIIRNIIAPGFPLEQQAQAVKIMRIDLIAILVFSISGLVMTGLQTHQHFLLPAMAPAFYNIGQIFGVMILAPTVGYSLGPVTLPAYGLGIYGLVYGVILGAFLHLGIQVPGLIRYQFHWIPVINLRDPGMVKVLHLLGPRILTMFFLQVFFIVRDNLASRLAEGSVTALNYGWFLMQVPETLIGSAIAIAILPTLSELFARGDQDAFMQTINRALRGILALTVPITILMSVAFRPLIKTILGFDDSGTDLVMIATRAYLLGLAGHALLELGARSFYAQQDARIPLFAAAINAGAYMIFALSLTSLMGFAGISLATSLSFTGEALLLFYLLNRRFRGVVRMNGTLFRVVLAGLVGGLVALGVMQISIAPAVFLGIGAMCLGALAALPFIWPEMKLLVRL